MENKKKWIILIAVVIIAVFLDQITKYWISHKMLVHQSITLWKEFFRITFVYNRGMVFGLKPHDLFPFLPVSKILVIFMSVATILLIVYYKFLQDNRNFSLFGLSFIISGALGNLIDRISANQVVDFLDVGVNERLRWPVFNLADSWITIGIIMLLSLAVLDHFKSLPEKERS